MSNPLLDFWKQLLGWNNPLTRRNPIDTLLGRPQSNPLSQDTIAQAAANVAMTSWVNATPAPTMPMQSSIQPTWLKEYTKPQSTQVGTPTIDAGHKFSIGLPWIWLDAVNKPIESAMNNQPMQSMEQKPVMPSVLPESGVSNSNSNIYGELFDDITKNWLTEAELAKYYPEIPENIRWSLFDDIKLNWLTEAEVGKYYPELSNAEQKPTILDQVKSDPILWFPTRAISWGVWVIGWWLKWLRDWITDWWKKTIQDIKDTWNDERKSIWEKIIEIPVWLIAAQFLWWDVVWWAVGGAMKWAYEWSLTNKEQKYMDKQIQWFMQSIAWSTDTAFIQKQLDKLSPLNQERAKDWLWYSLDALNLAWLEGAKPLLTEFWSIVKSWVKSAAKEGVEMAVKGWLKQPATFADNLLTNMNRLTKGEQSQFVNMQGETVGQFLNNRWIVAWGDDAVSQLWAKFIESKAKADAWLEAIQWTFTNDKLWLMVDDAARFANDTLDPQTSRLMELKAKYAQEWLTMEEINEVKRYFERNNKLAYGRDMTAAEKTVRATNIDNAVREWQLDEAAKNWFTNLREINKETQWFKYILDKLIKNDTGRLWNNAVSLTDWIVASQVPLTPEWIAMLVGKKVANTNWFKSNLIKILNRINGQKTIADKVVDLWTISAIQDEKALNKYLALPLKDADNMPFSNLSNINGNEWLVNTPWGVLTPKKGVKWPTSVREFGNTWVPYGTVKPKRPNTWLVPVSEWPLIKNPDFIATPDWKLLKKWYVREINNPLKSSNSSNPLKGLWKETLEQDAPIVSKWSMKDTNKTIAKVTNLNDWKDITLVRWVWGANNWAWESIRWKWLYLTDNIDVAKHYWSNIETVSIKNKDILDWDITKLNNVKKIISSLPNDMKRYLDDSYEYTYSSLLKTIEWNTGIESEKVAEAINRSLKDKYKWVKFKIWTVNDTLDEAWLWNENAFIIR